MPRNLLKEGDKALVSISLFRVLIVIATLASITLLSTGCADPCSNCTKIACSGNDIECRDIKNSNKAECEAKKKQAMMECEEYRALCFKACR